MLPLTSLIYQLSLFLIEPLKKLKPFLEYAVWIFLIFIDIAILYAVIRLGILLLKRAWIFFAQLIHKRNNTIFSKSDLNIRSDLPMVDPKHDKLGYAQFAQLIASSIVKMNTPEGLVMAIDGEWGLGKTSVLNFVKFYLEKEPKNSRPIVIDFNPWWFDDKNHLASQFLSQFVNKLRLEGGVFKNIGNLLAEYASSISKAAAVATGVPWIDEPLTFFLKIFKGKVKDIHKLKLDISTKLKSGGQRFLVIIDDVDRLTPAEIREVFKVIKALADFPNVIYLIALDRKVVEKALSDSLSMDGEAYLEKIIQVSFTLPIIPRGRLHQLLSLDLEKLTASSDISLFDQCYWGNIYLKGMDKLITKPRDIVRYVNALSVTFPPLKNEVNISDFFALEFLRINLPALYYTIRENPEYFSGYARSGIQSSERNPESEFHDRWAVTLDERIRSDIQSMMKHIFPRLDNLGRSGNCLSEWRKSMRAAAPDVFPNYFKFGIDAGSLRRASMIEFINGLDDQEQSQNTLLTAISVIRDDGTSQAKDYLDNLPNFKSEINFVRAVNLIRIIAQIGDNLIIKNDEDCGLFSIPRVWSILFIFQSSLAKISRDDRDAQLLSAFTDGKSITILCNVIFSIITTKNNPNDNSSSIVYNDVHPKTIELLQELALVRIAEMAADNSLAAIPQALFVLLKWQEWGQRKDSQKWAMMMISDSKTLIEFLSIFISESISTTIGDSVGRIKYSLNLKHLAQFVDLELVEKHLLAISNSEDSVINQQSLILKTFIHQYAIFKRGEDPDAPFIDSD